MCLRFEKLFNQRNPISSRPIIDISKLLKELTTETFENCIEILLVWVLMTAIENGNNASQMNKLAGLDPSGVSCSTTEVNDGTPSLIERKSCKMSARKDAMHVLPAPGRPRYSGHVTSKTTMHLIVLVSVSHYRAMNISKMVSVQEVIFEQMLF